MTDVLDRLDRRYREAGWGRVTDEALRIVRPADVESQARSVAIWASARIADLEAQLAEKETEISALRHGVDRLQTKAMVAVDRARDLEIESRFRTSVVKALPRPDEVFMTGGTICLEYADYDLRDEAYDWLEQQALHP